MLNSIKKLRKEAGLNQEEFAKLFNVHQTAVSQWETGKTSPDTDIIIKMAKYFKISTDDILCNTDIRDIKKAPTDESRDFDAMIDDISASGEDNEGVVMAKGGKGQKRIIIAEDDDEANFAAEAIKLFRKTKRKK